LRFVASRLLWQARLSSLFTINLSDGLRVRFYPSSISAALWVSPDERTEDASLLRRVLRPGERYIDCGANVGHLALVARSAVGPSGEVIAIEANPRIYRYCVGNLKLNGFSDVRAIHAALGESRGTVRISERRDDDQNRISDHGSEVSLHRLDELVEPKPTALLKLDVEGYELQVLRGATHTLAVVDMVYCELSASNCARFGGHPSDVEDLLLEAGFVFGRRSGTEWDFVHARVYETLLQSELPRTGYNLLAVKGPRVAELRSRLTSDRG
jgi:FkbM family methyltransferase